MPNDTLPEIPVSNLHNQLAAVAQSVNAVARAANALTESKVDKVTGKGLSTEDYTTAEKDKLSGIAEGAEVNTISGITVNGDAVAVTNKTAALTVPVNVSDLTNDSGFQDEQQVDNKIDAKVSSAYKAAGTKTAAELTSALLIAANEGKVLEGDTINYFMLWIVMAMVSVSLYQQRMQEAMDALKAVPRPSYKKIVDHIDHVVKLVGFRHVGLGSDFDGIEVCPDGLDDISKMQKIIIELRKRGYSEYEIRHIAGGNFLRVMEQVQRMAEAL